MQYKFISLYEKIMKTSFSNERAMNGKRQGNNANGPTNPPKVYESTISLDETSTSSVRAIH